MHKSITWLNRDALDYHAVLLRLPLSAADILQMEEITRKYAKHNSSKYSYIKLTVSVCGEGDGFVVNRLILQLPCIIAAVKSWNWRFTSYWSWICCGPLVFRDSTCDVGALICLAPTLKKKYTSYKETRGYRVWNLGRAINHAKFDLVVLTRNVLRKGLGILRKYSQHSSKVIEIFSRFSENLISLMRKQTIPQWFNLPLSNLLLFVQSSGPQSPARGPNPAREGFQSGPRAFLGVFSILAISCKQIYARCNYVKSKKHLL